MPDTAATLVGVGRAGELSVDNDLTQSIRIATECVLDGGVIAYPTEFCFGLGCNPDDEAAIKRLLKIKQRSAKQGLILIASATQQLDRYVEWDKLIASQLAHLKSTWPGPVSWLVPASERCSSLLRGEHTTLAVRIPAFKLMQDLCRSGQMPLVSTSANLHGKPALITAAWLETQLGEGIDYIIDQPVEGLAQASQIIDAMTRKILRP